MLFVYTLSLLTRAAFVKAYRRFSRFFREKTGGVSIKARMQKADADRIDFALFYSITETSMRGSMKSKFSRVHIFVPSKMSEPLATATA